MRSRLIQRPALISHVGRAEGGTTGQRMPVGGNNHHLGVKEFLPDSIWQLFGHLHRTEGQLDFPACQQRYQCWNWRALHFKSGCRHLLGKLPKRFGHD